MNRLASDPVFAALTRPQMIGGVTYAFAVFNLVVTVEAFLISRSFWALLIAVVLHAVGYVGCLREPRFFDLWLTKLRTCPRAPNFGFWRGNSYRP
jgi:type IV secretion system protein VirB3